MSKEYLAGAFRDGCLTVQYQIKIKQKCRAWLSDIIVPMLNEEFGLALTERAIYPQNDANERYYLAFKRKKVWLQLKELFEMPASKAGVWNTPTFLKTDNALLQDYIRGFFDAEGGVPRTIAGSKLYVSFTQKNMEPLEFIRDKLESVFGIKCGGLRISDKKSNVWQFRITKKESIARFADRISSWHPDKSARLRLMFKEIMTP